MSFPQQSAGGRAQPGSQAQTETPSPRTARAPRRSPAVRTRYGLSFWTERGGAKGRRASHSPFDVPLEAYVQGNATGYRVAAELLGAIRSGALDDGFCWLKVRRVIEAAVQALQEDPSKGVDEPSRKGAAVTFLDVMATCVMGAARNLDWERVIATHSAPANDGGHHG